MRSRSDFEQAPCPCGECVQAGVAGFPQLRDWSSGKWLHGYDLKRVYEAKDAFWKKAHEAFGLPDQEPKS